MIGLILTFIVNWIIVFTLFQVIQMLTTTFHIGILHVWNEWAGIVLSESGKMEQNSLFLAAILLIISAVLSRGSVMQYFLCKVNQCRRPGEEEKLRLRRIFTNICRKAGIDEGKYRLYMCAMPGWNAFAIGNNHIAVTTSLYEYFSDRELMGIMAHELGHIQHKDTVYLTMKLSMEWIGQLVIRFYSIVVLVLQIFRFIPVLNIFIAFVTLFFSIQIYFFQIFMQLPLWFTERFLSRRQEYAADQYACEIGLGEELYEGLYKISLREERRSFFQRLTSTHPETKSRLKKIRSYVEAKYI